MDAMEINDVLCWYFESEREARSARAYILNNKTRGEDVFRTVLFTQAQGPCKVWIIYAGLRGN